MTANIQNIIPDNLDLETIEKTQQITKLEHVKIYQGGKSFRYKICYLRFPPHPSYV